MFLLLLHVALSHRLGNLIAKMVIASIDSIMPWSMWDQMKPDLEGNDLDFIRRHVENAVLHAGFNKGTDTLRVQIALKETSASPLARGLQKVVAFLLCGPAWIIDKRKVIHKTKVTNCISKRDTFQEAIVCAT